LAAGLLLLAAAAAHLVDGSPILRSPGGSELAALAYLAVAVTAVVFGAWFAAVHRLGVKRAGLFNGLVPVASLAAITLVGTGAATRAQLIGALTVLVGLLLGLTGNCPRTVRPRRAQPPSSLAISARAAATSSSLV
jgi:drug/metabolite transporter (DMT)-like permease